MSLAAAQTNSLSGYHVPFNIPRSVFSFSLWIFQHAAGNTWIRHRLQDSVHVPRQSRGFSKGFHGGISQHHNHVFEHVYLSIHFSHRTPVCMRGS